MYLKIKIGKIVLAFLLIFGCIHANGQRDFQIGVDPSIYFDMNWPRSWSSSLELQMRQVFNEKGNGEIDPSFKYSFAGSSLTLSKKVSPFEKFAFKYQIRFDNKRQVHTFVQRYAISDTRRRLTYSHRIALDEILRPGDGMEIRFRYRFTMMLPFKGNRIDIKEFYFKAKNEYRISFVDYKGVEVTVGPLMGYKWSKDLLLEAGFNYRIKSFQQTVQSVIWLDVGIYFNL